jgi:hypothetical protein
MNPKPINVRVFPTLLQDKRGVLTDQHLALLPI